MNFRKTITQTHIADINGDAFVSEVVMIKAKNLREAIEESVKPYGRDTFYTKIYPRYATTESDSKGIHIEITAIDELA